MRWRSPTCGKPGEERHIGKSSSGWCFAVHIHPEIGIKTWGDWKECLKEGGEIRDEYGEDVTFEEMVATVEERYWVPPYERSQHFYEVNHAEPGPNNLMRHKIDGRFCVGHGGGTWDLMEGKFS